MFERIKKYFRDVRINLDFHKYEQHCRLKHKKQAERNYSTALLEKNKNNLLSQINSQASHKFDGFIKSKREEINSAQSIAKEKESKLSYFTRYYKQEINELYKDKDKLLLRKNMLYENNDELKRDISEAFEEKKKAYKELNYYKDQVDEWHAKSSRSGWLFGNAKKKLPKHSLFGQSFGDLDSYKYSRDSAYKDVREAKNQIGYLKQEQHKLHLEITEIKNKVGDIFNQINQAKKDRGKMYELKEAGYNKNKLQKELADIYTFIQETNAKLLNIESDKYKYVVTEKHSTGVIELESKIAAIKMKKEQFINSFDLKENLQKRKKAHRELWLKKRNML